MQAKPLNHLWLLCILQVLIGYGAAAVAGESKSLSWRQEPGKSVSLVAGDRIVWQFCYAQDQPKPYFHPVALADGPLLTWNSPPDHPWHHALWFSWKFLAGVNYWEPDASGKPPGNTSWDDARVLTRLDHSARIEIHFQYAPNDDPTILTERRVIEISAPKPDGGYHFDWTCTFTAGEKDVRFDRTPLPGEPGGVPYGGYAGLSLRLAKELADRQAATPDGPVEFSQSRYRGKATAMDYNGTINSQAVGIAVCDHPANLNHPTPWYAICSEPMSYFSPAVICYKPHTLEGGQSFTLRYRIIVHPDRWDAGKLQKEYQQFAAESRAEKR